MYYFNTLHVLLRRRTNKGKKIGEHSVGNRTGFSYEVLNSDTFLRYIKAVIKNRLPH